VRPRVGPVGTTLKQQYANSQANRKKSAQMRMHIARIGRGLDGTTRTPARTVPRSGRSARSARACPGGCGRADRAAIRPERTPPISAFWPFCPARRFIGLYQSGRVVL